MQRSVEGVMEEDMDTPGAMGMVVMVMEEDTEVVTVVDMDMGVGMHMEDIGADNY